MSAGEVKRAKAAKRESKISAAVTQLLPAAQVAREQRELKIKQSGALLAAIPLNAKHEQSDC